MVDIRFHNIVNSNDCASVQRREHKTQALPLKFVTFSAVTLVLKPKATRSSILLKQIEQNERTARISC